MGPMGEAEESQPNPGQPVIDLAGKKIRHDSQPDKGQAVKEIEIIRLSQKPANHRTLHSFYHLSLIETKKGDFLINTERLSLARSESGNILTF